MNPHELKTHADDLYAKQDYAGATSAFRELLEQQPHSTQIMKSLGLSLILSKQIDEGTRICKTAAAMQPADAELRYAYGYALGAGNRFEEAISELDAALNLVPNHVPARQGLIYCLLSAGESNISGNPHLAEQHLDRAKKLDSKNAHVTAKLLEFYVGTQQKGKAVKLIQGLDAQMKQQEPLKALLERLQNEDDYRTHLRHVAVSQQTAPRPAATPPANAQSLKQVPCPNCRQPIMDYAAICPHCGFRNRATGTFAGRDTGPKYEWQEIAFTLMAILWSALAVWQVTILLPEARKEQFVGFRSFMLFLAGAQALIGLGLLFRQGWVGFLAKCFCYLTLLFSSILFMLTFFSGQYLRAGLEVLQMGITGFMIYLINYVLGD